MIPNRVIEIRWARKVLLAIGWIWRRLLFRTTFIAISGSVGKSTCKELTGEVLASRYPTVRTVRNENHFRGVTRSLLRVRPWHRFAVIEIGLDRPGQMAAFARVVKPHVAVWVNVARTHSISFPDLATTAREKSKLVESLRPGGVAILNDDNPYIAAYQPPAGVRTIYYGSTERSAFRYREVRGHWPERLSMTVTGPDEERRIETRLLGEHWIPSILPALALGKLFGISLGEAGTAISRYAPLEMRLSPMVLPNGATLLRDEYNGSADTLGPALRVLEQARAQRKILLFTDVADSKEKPRRRLRDVGTTAARIADAAIFLGEHSAYAVRAAIAAGMPADQVWSFYDIAEAAQHLRAELRVGDLVLLRGRTCDHLARLPLSLTGEVKCWKNYCSKSMECGDCPELR